MKRREALKHGVTAAGAVLALPRLGTLGTANPVDATETGSQEPLVVGGQPVEVTTLAVGQSTVRVTVRPLVNNEPTPIPVTGALANDGIGTVRQALRTRQPFRGTAIGPFMVGILPSGASFQVQVTRIRDQEERALQFDAAMPDVMLNRFDGGPILGLGEGGPQFDRRGSVDTMRAGQGGFRLETHGTRAPVQWLIDTTGWAIFIHQPYGSFDFTGPEAKFTPRGPAGAMDFFITTGTPEQIMREYAVITGFPEMPARWTFGYQQSHRTLEGRDGILAEAKTFREKKLPCDTMIYLGTEFAPSGWNTKNGETTWHPTNFPDPKVMMDQLHADHFKVVVHIVVESSRLLGKVTDPCTAAPLPPGRTPDNRWPPERQASCYWPSHTELMQTGVDGFWPDQGDGLDGPSRFNRHRMYYDGMQQARPNERPFALHRNASPGIQRFGGFIWSGDVRGQWETLATHVAVGINSGLSGFPYWGTDIGGFNPTPEYTGELHTRWFQFAAFCTSFRAHGRNWHLKLPWGWNGGDGGPSGDNGLRINPAELHNAEVEPILKKYLELRYQLMPYTYTAVRDAHETGIPIMRALWLHYPTDATAVARGDEYLWGRDLLVAPVVEKGATSRKLYLPRGKWVDYWTERSVDGGAEVSRDVDLGTMPLYVRAGATIPLGPIKQYTEEPSDAPTTLIVYPGADGESSLYDDDGHTFNHRNGEWMRIQLVWRDATRDLTLRLAPGSRTFGPMPNRFVARVAGTQRAVPITFTGQPITTRL